MKPILVLVVSLLVLATLGGALAQPNPTCAAQCNWDADVQFSGCGNDKQSRYFSVTQNDCFNNCNTTVYYAGTCNCPNNCMNSRNGNLQRGACSSDGTQCQCKPGWTGPDCSIITCGNNQNNNIKIGSTGGNSCLGRGKCVTTMFKSQDPQSANADVRYDYCECQPGYTSGLNGCVAREQPSLQGLAYPELFPELGPYYADDPYGDNHPLFNLSKVASIQVEMDERDYLELIYPNTVREVDYKPVNFTFDNGVVRERLEMVGMKLKGKGNTRHYKKGYKFAFDKYGHKDRLFYNLAKLGTKSGSDMAMLRNVIPPEVLRSMMVPTQRIGFTTVYINGRYMGAYVLMEEYEKQWVRSRMVHHKGNLYKCTYKADLVYYGDVRFCLLVLLVW